MNLFPAVANWLFGCAHRKTSLPVTIGEETYVACLECGLHITYDWNAMSVSASSGSETAAKRGPR